MNKKKLLALIAKKNERKAALTKQAETCEDVATLRSINAEMDSLNEETRSLQELADGMPDDSETSPDNPAGLDENGQSARTRAVNAGIPPIVQAGAANHAERSGDKYSSMEYRKAFMDYVTRGTPVPAEYRSDAFTSVTDAAAVIPTTIMSEIIKQMKVYGQLFSRVRKTSVPGGVQYPIMSLKPVATRITESTPSDRKKVTANTYVTFAYIGLECKIATGLLASLTTIPAFEDALSPLIVDAMVKQQEVEIIKGVGTTEMLGVTVDTRVPAANTITLSASDFGKWDSWKKKVFAKIPLAYRNGVFVMGAGTFDGYIDGMVDANGQPIGRTNYGITEGTQYRFGGKEVIEVEEDVISGYDTAETGDVVAVFMNPTDYAINSNMEMAMYRWFDHDMNQWVDKALLVNDGKLLDANGVFIIKKGA